jgi:hypothetical protein
MIALSQRKLPNAVLAVALALTGTLASFHATTAQAATQRSGYSAALSAPLDAPRREIIRGTLWKCEGDRCTASGQGSRPVMLCARVVKKFGTVTRFAAPEGELSAEDLAKCNAG